MKPEKRAAMKKIFVVLCVLTLMGSLPAFAEEASEKEMKCCKGMGWKTQMVATDEGGVIVLAGNKLIKYDADLNVEKEVEVKMPMGGKTCPMMKASAGGETSMAGMEKKTT